LWNEVLNTAEQFARMYESNIEDLGHELHQFRRILERKIQSGMQRPSSVVELALFIEPYKEVFFELFKLCKIAVSIPVSTASCEQSFSALKLVKTYLRSTMSDDRLSNLGVLIRSTWWDLFVSVKIIMHKIQGSQSNSRTFKYLFKH
uniref:HAT C-terminal dimerisation domain-containing protein n=1 Tax=Hucho hucho TaxID=62062 RepID=A0A4W5L160_9TELE